MQALELNLNMVDTKSFLLFTKCSHTLNDLGRQAGFVAQSSDDHALITWLSMH